jgi:hypothetical protein
MKPSDYTLRKHIAAETPHTTGGAITIAPTNIAAQVAAGAAVALASGDITAFPRHGCTLQITLGAGGVATDYVVTGTWNGRVVTETIALAAAGTEEGSQPFEAVTSVVTAADPQGTTDVQTLDAVFMADGRVQGSYPTPRWLWVGSAGNVSVRLLEDDSDVAYIAAPIGRLDIRPAVIRCSKAGRVGITETTASNMVWGA